MVTMKIDDETTYATALFECVAEADHLASLESRVVNAEKPCYKTKKDPSNPASRNSDAKGATLTVRFADHLGIKHSFIDAYKAGDSGAKSEGNLGHIREIATAIVNHFAPSATDKASLVALCAEALRAYGNPPTTVEADTVVAPPTIEFGVAPTTVVEAPAPAPAPADPLAGLIPATASIPVPQVATATENGDKVVLSTWDEFCALLPSIGQQEAQIDALIMDFYYNRYQSNGVVPRYSTGGKKELSANRIKEQLGWDNAKQKAYMHMAGDILRIAHHRQSNGKMRQWFFQLVKGNADELGNRMWLLKALVGAVLSKAQPAFYNQRLTKFVGAELREAVIKAISVNTELRDSAVIGGTASSWNWKFDEGNWKSTGRTEVASIDASNFSLDNL